MKCLIISLFLSFASFPIAGQYITHEDSRSIGLMCEETFKDGNFPGMAVMVAKGDSVIWAKGYGYANIEDTISIDPYKSVFRIGSISKTVTAAGLAILVEAGKVDLDNAVRNYVPYFPEKKYPLTVRQISGHIGGIRHYEGMEFMSNLDYVDVASGIEIFKDSDLLFEPGTKYSYSSYGWNLISAVIEGGSREPFRKFMKKNVFDPSGMKSIYAEGESIHPENMVRFYMHNGEGSIIPSFQVNNSYKWAGGGFIASAPDLVSFSNAIQKNLLYGEKVKQHFWESCTLTDGSSTNYGIGWATNIDDDGRKWVGHSGGSAGGTSMYLLYPDEELTVITLVNLSGAQMERLALRIADQLLDKE